MVYGFFALACKLGSRPAEGFGWQHPRNAMTEDFSTDATADVHRNVNESADKIVLNTKIKRGSGTRDQDEIKVKVKANDPQQAAEKLHATVTAVGEQGTVNALRGTQPSSAGGSDE